MCVPVNCWRQGYDAEWILDTAGWRNVGTNGVWIMPLILVRMLGHRNEIERKKERKEGRRKTNNRLALLRKNMIKKPWKIMPLLICNEISKPATLQTNTSSSFFYSSGISDMALTRDGIALWWTSHFLFQLQTLIGVMDTNDWPLKFLLWCTMIITVRCIPN